jgi:predicted nucleic acid-binding protein
MVILDTNIIIDHLRKSQNLSWLRKINKTFNQKELAISVISVQELFEGQSTLNQKAETFLIATLAPLQIVPYKYEIAKLAGKINRDLKIPIGFPDAAIAATTIEHCAQLATLNAKHFQNIPELELLGLEEL